MDESIEEFGALFARFLRQVVDEAPERESGLAERLREHLGIDALAAPSTEAMLATFEHPDLQVALDAYLADGIRSHEVVGWGGGHGMGFADVLAHTRAKLGAPAYVERPVDVDQHLSCLQTGVVLVTDPATQNHIIVVATDERGPFESLSVRVLSEEQAHGRAVLSALRALMAEHSVYRGKVFTLANPNGPFGGRNVGASFMPRPEVDRAAIVLPDGRLERIERRTFAFDDVAQQLATQGMSRKRGLLLYGPPGTGKTLTARYLMGRMPERTVVVLTGQSLGAIEPAASLAGRLQPAMLILEDVDLVGHDRSFGLSGNPILFELLNALDGLGERERDVIVLLTTNRADLLEPALAARPGRVDLAVELPLPDEAGRERLLALYFAHVPNDIEDWTEAIERTDGTPASFIKELVRTAALIAAERESPRITQDDLTGALDELLESGPLTAALLGARWGDGDQPLGAGPGPGPMLWGQGHAFTYGGEMRGLDAFVEGEFLTGDDE